MFFILLIFITFTSPSTVNGQYETNQGPVFIIEPKVKIEFMNTVGARIDCSTHGYPKPETKWITSDNREVYMVPGLRNILKNGSILLLPFTSDQYRQDVHAVNYICISSNIYGTIRSTPIQVRAVMEQVYEGQVYDEYVIRGNVAVFKCQLPSFVRDDVIVSNWFVDNEIIKPNDDEYLIFPSGKLHVVSVDDSNDMQKFRCETRHRLNGAIHTSSGTGTLHVTDSRSSIQPQKGHHEVKIITEEGSTIGLPCAVQSYPTPSYLWLKLDEPGSKSVALSHKSVTYKGGSIILDNVKTEDSGQYQCYINNSLGHLTLNTKLVVTAPLRVYIDNQRQVVDVGKSVNLSCIITGHPVDKIEWTRNGLILDSTERIQFLQNRRLLFIKTVERIDAGMYQCFVSNDVQRVQGASQLLLGDMSPELTEVFKPLTLQPGPSVNLKCVSVGTPIPRVTWLLDDQAIVPNLHLSTNSFVGVGRTLISFLNISSVKVYNGGEYTCVAANNVGSTKYSARLDVFGVPRVRPMANLSVASNEEFIIKCSVYGFPISEITWKKDGEYLSSTDKRTVYKNGTIHVVDNERARDAGKYTCTARNRQGQMSGGSRHIIIIDKPVISDFKFPTGVTEGMQVTILCNILTGDPPVTIAWMKDGELITPNLGIVITDTSSYSILDIRNVQRLHSGNYSCQATNKAGLATQYAILTVQGSPEWVIRPKQSVVVAARQSVKIHCQGAGYPTPTVTWTRAGSEMPSRTSSGSRIIKLDNNTLIFRDVRKLDQGLYTCQVSNGIKPDLYANVRLTVGTAPEIFISNSKINATINRSAKIICQVTGDPTLEINWTKKGERHRDLKDRHQVIRSNVNGISYAKLMIQEISREDAGAYDCNANNIFGSATSTIEMVVQEPPGPVTDVTLMNASNFTLLISWTQPVFDGKSEITSYSVFYTSRGSMKSPMEFRHVVKDDERKYKVQKSLTGFKANHQYKLWIVANNAVGASSKSSEPLFRFLTNGTLILTSQQRNFSRSSVNVPNLTVLLVVPSVTVVVVLIVVIIVVFVIIRRNSRNRSSRPDESETKRSEELYKNIGLLAELKDKHNERYGKIQPDSTSTGGESSRYQPLYNPEYQKRYSHGIELYSAPSVDIEPYYSEVTPYATSGVTDGNKKVEMKTFTMQRLLGDTGVTAL
ncbi:Uncharacterised protein at_DN1330 [Pycnogonum litorale]